MKHPWFWFAAALVVAGLIVTCNIKQAKEWAALQSPEQDTVQMAMDALQGNPTAAGKKK
jgi:hypothetical protein